jgi:quercetin dioxygenase-like cupin family protein
MSHRKPTSVRIPIVALSLVFLPALPGPASAEDAAYPTVPLLDATTTIVGEPLHYPTGSPAHVTAAIISLAPGARTSLHRHGVPLFAYILEGEITVDYGDRGKRTYRAGDAVMEAMAVPHYGLDTGRGPVRILAVYMGAEGSANVIPAEQK